MKIKRKSIVKLPPAEGSVSDTANVEDEITNAPSIRLAKEMGLNGVPIDSIIPYDGDEIPEGFEEVDTFISDMANLFFQIGYTFIDTSGTIDYSNHLGLTWEKTLQGVTPVGQNASDTDFATVGKTGGEKTHTLTVDEMPSHTHRYVEYSGELTTTNAIEGLGIISQKNPFEADTHSTGGNFAHNNLQPYITCYMWKRTA